MTTSGSESTPPETIAEYVERFDSSARAALAEVLARFRRAAPGAAEAIAYEMPEFRLANNRRVYFAGWKQHLSLHGIPAFARDLEAQVEPYRSGRDTTKFSYRAAIPYDLIEAIVRAINAQESDARSH